MKLATFIRHIILASADEIAKASEDIHQSPSPILVFENLLLLVDEAQEAAKLWGNANPELIQDFLNMEQDHQALQEFVAGTSIRADDNHYTVWKNVTEITDRILYINPSY